MKKLIFLTLFAFGSILSRAQAPTKMSYQAVVRGASNNLIINNYVNMRLSILQGSNTGTLVYMENQRGKTNDNGLVSFEFGGGQVTYGDLTAIDWSKGPFFLKTETEIPGNGGYTITGTTQLLSVPYAFYAGQTTNVSGIISIGHGGTGADNVTKARFNLGLDLDSIRVANEIVRAQAAEATKENSANKSTDGTLASNSNIKFPTEKAVKTYVDATSSNGTAALAAEINNRTTAEAGLTVAINNETTNRRATDLKIISSLDAETTRAEPAETALTNSISDETNNRTAADLTLANLVSNETSRALSAEALKEDAANKSTDGTLASNSDLKFPTEKAVKTYVDTQLSSATPDATSSTKGKIQLGGDLAGTGTSAAAPIITDNAITTVKIADGQVTNDKLAGGIDLPTKTTGILPIANGGTGASTKTAAFDALSPMTTTGDLIYGGSNGTGTRLGIGTNGQFLTIASGVPSWVSQAASTLTTKTISQPDPFDFATTSYLNGPLDLTVAENLGVGQNILTANSNGIANVAVGIDNLSSNTTGSSNTSVGFLSMKHNTTGHWNTGVGSHSLYANTTGFANTAFGNDALLTNTEGSRNTSIGEWTMFSNTTGYQNTALGMNALFSNTTGINNVGVGVNALFNSTTSQNNVGVGNFSLNYTTTGGFNSALGTDVLNKNTSGNSNSALGFRSLFNNTTGNNNAAIGLYSLLTNTTGSQNTAIGQEADVTSGNLSNAMALGYKAKVAASNTIQLGNTSVTNVKTSGTVTAGAVTYPNTDGSANQVLTTDGSGVLSWITPNSGLTTIGSIANSSDANGATISGSTLTLTPADGSNGGVLTSGTQTIGGDKTFNGLSTFNNTLTVNGNSSINGSVIVGDRVVVNGVTIGTPGVSGSQNTMLGTASFAYSSDAGLNNTGLGHFTLASNNGGNDNTAVGTNVLRQGGQADGSRNTGVGSAALGNAAGTNDNTAIGYNALSVNTTGNGNTALGSSANLGTNGLTNATAIGYQATVAASNTIQLGNSSVTNVKTSGTLTAGTVTYPNSDGTANQVLTTDGSGALSWTTPSSGLTAVGAIANSSDAKGATISGSTISLTPADDTNGGIVTNGTQSFAGDKTFKGNVASQGSITGNAAISSTISADFTIDSSNFSSYNGKVLVCNPSSAITITLDNTTELPQGFNFMVVQKSSNANTIAFAAGTNVTLVNRNSYTKTAGQYAMATLVYIGGNLFVTSGDMQ